MKTKSETLILDLIESSRKNLNYAESLKAKSNNELNWKENENTWSVLECLEHVNLYGDFYIPEIEKVIKTSTNKSEVEFKSGWLGNYFAESMLPKEKLNKMKTFKDKNPLNSNLDRSVIDRFIHQQLQLINLLDKARSVSLTKTKTQITLSKLIKLRLGDTFRFVINHTIRHVQQMDRVIKQIPENV